MKAEEYIAALRTLINDFEQSLADCNEDNDFSDWNHALDLFMSDHQQETCPTCDGEGYCEERIDVDAFKPYPCPDCAHPVDPDYQWDDEDITDEYREWAGIEDPYGEPAH